MRLHHLSVTAFGPFVDPVEVDFDSLCDAGLFLLSGATGAGKSSVLDAVCFALYGAVPGDRQRAGRLRSDQAPAGLAPRVCLEATLSGRRFRLVRSPAWDRPKKRGSGTTREQARVTVSELADGVWQPLTSRLDEAGDLVAGLLGMNLDQFCQVALLPQGHFQAFLRADSAQRHRLLSRLFRTGRFERVETWLRDHRLALRRACEEHAFAVGDLVSRLSEAAGTPVPEALDDLAAAAEVHLPAWARTVHDDAAARRTTTAADAVAAAETHHRAAAAAAAARDLSAARSRVVAAAETVERLDARADDHLDELARLERARRAQRVGPLARLAAEREAALERARDALEASRTHAGRAGLGVDDPTGELERITGELAALTVLLPAECRREELWEQHAVRSQEHARLTEEEELGVAEGEALAALARELAAEVAAADVAARDLPHAEADLARLQVVTSGHADLARLGPEIAEAVAEHAQARARVIDLREHLLDLRERRIAGMAAELAGDLVVGGDCPVCGSADHPRPAVPTSQQTDGEAERRAQRDVDDAQAVEHALQLKVRDLEAARARAAQAAADCDPAAAATSLAATERTLTALRARVETASASRARLDETTQRAESLADADARRRLRLTELATTQQHLADQIAELDASLGAARGEHPGLREAVAHVTGRRDLVRTVRSGALAAESAEAAWAEALAALERTAAEAGFDTVDDALAAQLPETDLARLAQDVDDHRLAMASARQVLGEPDALDLLTAPAPDVRALEHEAGLATETSERARAAAETAERTEQRVRRLCDQLDTALAAWGPVRAELAVATRVASFAEGKAADNRWQMRLSAYVLAHRLSQVVAAANARLSGMSDQRYTLEHVGRRGTGETRGGLSLVVRDDWSGEARDPATLSGGETFVASLALALGLADVVAHEAGGADLQTLFVDEGFGSLDAETLDDVLDILDSLREGGRAVGVVSHVAEMRHRIPTQLVVTKARTGSLLRVTG